MKKNITFSLLGVVFVIACTCLNAQTERIEKWISEVTLSNDGQTQITSVYNSDLHHDERIEDNYLLTIFTTPDIPISEIYLYNDEQLYSRRNFHFSADGGTALISEGTYKLLLCYQKKHISETCLSIVFRKDIVIDNDLKITVLEEEAIHEVNFQFYYPTGQLFSPDGSIPFTAMFLYEITDKLLINYSVSNRQPCLKISDIESDDFQFFNANIITPPYPYTSTTSENSFYFVVNEPISGLINEKTLFANHDHNFIQTSFTFPGDTSFHSDSILSDIRFGQILMRPYYFGYTEDIRYKTEIVTLFSSIKRFNSIFQPFFQPLCNYSKTKHNYNLNQEMSGRIKSNIFLFSEGDSIVNTWIDLENTPFLKHDHLLDNQLTHIYPINYEISLGYSAPVFYFQNKNGMTNSYSVNSIVYPFGQHGEWREIDYLCGRAQFFCDGEELFNDSLYKWQELSTGKRRECDLIITSAKTIYDDKECYSVATSHFNQRIDDSNPPTLSMFRVLNNKNNIAHILKTKSGSKLEFTTGDYHFKNNQFIFNEKADVKVFWSMDGKNEWNQINVEEIEERFDSITGNFYTVNLEQLENTAPSWIDLRIVCTDYSGNSVIQELFPAFYMLEQVIVEIKEDSLTSERGTIQVYPNPTRDRFKIQSTKFKIREIQIFDVLGRTVLNQECNNSGIQEMDISHLLQGIYFMKIKTNEETIIKKIVKQ